MWWRGFAPLDGAEPRHHPGSIAQNRGSPAIISSELCILDSAILPFFRNAEYERNQMTGQHLTLDSEFIFRTAK